MTQVIQGGDRFPENFLLVVGCKGGQEMAVPGPKATWQGAKHLDM